METHRYVRKNLVQSASEDRYGLNLKKAAHPRSASNQASAENWSTEYWTNGTTTLLSVPSSKPLQNPIPIRQSPVVTSSAARYTYPISNLSDMTSETAKQKLTTPTGSSSSSTLIRNSLMAGSVAGMASTMACHPFDVLRVKMQSTALASTHLGLSGTVRHTVQFGGFRALYTGLTLPLAAQAIYKGTVFTVNNITEQAIKEWKTQENYKLGNFTPYKLTLFDRFLSGFMGGAVNAALFVTPVEFVRNQQIAQANGNNNSTLKTSSFSSRYSTRTLQGPLSVVRATLQSDGPAGLWRGMASTILRDSLGCGCFFAVMAYSQQLLSAQQEVESGGPPSKSVLITSGAAAGVAFWVFGLPLDTMKTWIQNGSARNLRHAWEMSQRDGFLRSIVSLNRGWQVAYGRGAPSAAITVTTYSLVYTFLNHKLQQQSVERVV